MYGFDEILKIDPEVAAAMTDEITKYDEYLRLITYDRVCGENYSKEK